MTDLETAADFALLATERRNALPQARRRMLALWRPLAGLVPVLVLTAGVGLLAQGIAYLQWSTSPGEAAAPLIGGVVLTAAAVWPLWLLRRHRLRSWAEWLRWETALDTPPVVAMTTSDPALDDDQPFRLDNPERAEQAAMRRIGDREVLGAHIRQLARGAYALPLLFGVVGIFAFSAADPRQAVGMVAASATLAAAALLGLIRVFTRAATFARLARDAHDDRLRMRGVATVTDGTAPMTAGGARTRILLLGTIPMALFAAAILTRRTAESIGIALIIIGIVALVPIAVWCVAAVADRALAKRGAAQAGASDRATGWIGATVVVDHVKSPPPAAHPLHSLMSSGGRAALRVTSDSLLVAHGDHVREVPLTGPAHVITGALRLTPRRTQWLLLPDGTQLAYRSTQVLPVGGGA